MWLLVLVLVTIVSADYNESRESMLRYERSTALGNQIQLSDKEHTVDAALMAKKLTEYEEGFREPGKFLAAQHFFFAKEGIERSSVFNFIQRMPKGALLHAHDTAMASGDYVYNLTFTEGLYGCKIDDRIVLHFAPNEPQCDWKLMTEWRADTKFDAWLKTKLSLILDEPHINYPNVNAAWSSFMNIFGAIGGMLTYVPVFKDYFTQVLQEAYDDNIMYVEFRGTLPTLYDLNNNTYGPLETVRIYNETLSAFKEKHPDFHNARFIYAPNRNVDKNNVLKYLQIAQQIKENYPDFFAGFDLVGQEDLGKPLLDFVDALQNNSITTFYHAGETNWNGESTDLNLLDAVLLGAKRIGHGYAITKHPAVLNYVKEHKIAIEICPISNQVLKLVEDLRNHPATFLFANDYPVVISNDDPSFWGAKGLSYDWYYAFMAFASKESGLKTLKQLALNSLNYSTISGEEKVRAMKLFEEKWNRFIHDELQTM